MNCKISRIANEGPNLLNKIIALKEIISRLSPAAYSRFYPGALSIGLLLFIIFGEPAAVFKVHEHTAAGSLFYW